MNILLSVIGPLGNPKMEHRTLIGLAVGILIITAIDVK